MSAPNDGGPAFPVGPKIPALVCTGMSLRDYFAGQVLSGLFAGGQGLTVGPHEPNDNAKIARVAYCLADAMLEARSLPNVKDMEP